MADEKGVSTGKVFLLVGAVVLWVAGAYLIKQGSLPGQGKPEPTPTPMPSPTSTPEPEPTPLWQEYESESLDIKLTYPQNWLLDETNNLIQITNYDPETAPGRGYIPEQDGDLFKVEIFADEEFSDVDQWLEDRLGQTDPITGEPMEILDREDVEIDGQTAIFYETESAMSGLEVGNVHVETPDGGILHIYGQLNYPDHKEDFEQIYQSVEFTNAT